MEPFLYRIEAYYSNAAVPPLVRWQSRYSQALNHAIDLVATGNHTTIIVTTPDNLEVIRFWGQLKGFP